MTERPQNAPTPRPSRQKESTHPALCPRADARTRTGDPFITSEVLYQLSYVGEVAPGRSRGPRPGRDDEG